MITLCGYHSGMRGMWVILAFCLAMPTVGLRADTLEGKAVLVDGEPRQRMTKARFAHDLTAASASATPRACLKVFLA